MSHPNFPGQPEGQDPSAQQGWSEPAQPTEHGLQQWEPGAPSPWTQASPASTAPDRSAQGPQDPYAAPQYGSGQPQASQDPYAAPQYGSGQPQVGQDPYAAPQQGAAQPQASQDPYAAPQYGSGQPQAGQDPYAAPQQPSPSAAPQYGSGQPQAPQDPYAAPQQPSPSAAPQYGSGQAQAAQDPYAAPQQGAAHPQTYQAPAAVSDSGARHSIVDPHTGEIHPVEGVESLQGTDALLVVVSGPDAGAQILLDTDVVTVGRSPNADIFLDDVTVSRRHAEFVRTPSGFLLRDTGSLNGTYVSRQLIDSVDLTNGADVQIGKFRMIFQQRPRT